MKNLNIIPALDKAVSVLEYLGETKAGATQSELARSLDITASTCYRILQTLLARNWVCQKPGGIYDVSRGILIPALKIMNGAARFECLQPMLDRLAIKTGLSCKLSIRQADRQVSVLRAESPSPMAVSGKVGAFFPLIEGATGAALVQGEPEGEIKRLLDACAEDIEEKSHPELVCRRLEQLAKVNYCMNSCSNRWHVETMAAPLKDNDGKVMAALTIVGFAHDFREENIKTVSRCLLETIDECSRQILPASPSRKTKHEMRNP